MTTSANIGAALTFFSVAREYVTSAQLEAEIDWQRNMDFAAFSESDLLREAAWVILCSGFRERTVRAAFDHISLCFCDWESAKAIVDAGEVCRTTALGAFGNKAKIKAIFDVAKIVNDEGFSETKYRIANNPIFELQKFPFIGAITSQHLAKNLGFDIAKDDRHLLRISRDHGFVDANTFCSEISKATGEKSSVVDIVVWRYLADNPAARGTTVLN